MLLLQQNIGGGVGCVVLKGAHVMSEILLLGAVRSMGI